MCALVNASCAVRTTASQASGANCPGVAGYRDLAGSAGGRPELLCQVLQLVHERVPVAAILLAGHDYPVWTSDVPLVLLGSVASTSLWCLFGAAVGALVRNMVAAIIVAFVWVMYVEWALVSFVPDVGRWTPTGVAKAASGWTRDALSSGPFPAGDLLPVWAGALVMIAYAVIAAVAARLISVRRDVTWKKAGASRPPPHVGARKVGGL